MVSANFVRNGKIRSKAGSTTKYSNIQYATNNAGVRLINARSISWHLNLFGWRTNSGKVLRKEFACKCKCISRCVLYIGFNLRTENKVAYHRLAVSTRVNKCSFLAQIFICKHKFSR